MANLLSPSGNATFYTPLFYAQTALTELRKALGMANTVNVGYDAERRQFDRGDTIKITQTGSFEAQSHVPGTGTTRQDIKVNETQIVLDKHEEVKFGVTDREISKGSEAIIRDHIGPAAYALALKIDSDLNALHLKVPYAYDIASGDSATDILTKTRKIMRDNKVPFDQQVFAEIDPTLEAKFLADPIFHEARITGGQDNQDALMRAMLAERFGFNIYSNQNVAEFDAPGTASAGGDNVGALAADADFGADTLSLTDFTATETLKAGDSFSIAGDSHRYVVAEDATFAGSPGAATVKIFPRLRQSASSGAVVTVEDVNASGNNGDSYSANMAYHRNAFALAFGRLPQRQDGAGVMYASVQDPVTGLAIRARMFDDGDTATRNVALDTLYGVQAIRPELAVKMRRDV